MLGALFAVCLFGLRGPAILREPVLWLRGGAPLPPPFVTDLLVSGPGGTLLPGSPFGGTWVSSGLWVLVLALEPVGRAVNAAGRSTTVLVWVKRTLFGGGRI